MNNVLNVLKANGIKDMRIKLSKTAQIELAKNDVFTFFMNETKLDFEQSIVRNKNISDSGKDCILYAKDSIKTKRAIMKQTKKATGRLFDKVSAEENMYENSTKAEQAVLDGYIMQSLREKAYLMYTLEFSVLEWDGENPKKLQFEVKSRRVTRSGKSQPITYGIATVSRNYVSLSDFVPTVDTKTEQLVSILITLFEKWTLTKEMCGTWIECAERIQDVLKEYENTDFEQICKYIELEVQKENN